MLNRAKPYLNFQKIVKFISDTDLSNDDYVRIFEKKFSDYIKSPLCIAVNQGRSALLIALKSLGVTKGDEVIVQSLICQAVIDIILETGATPVLVDSIMEDYNISPLEIQKKITPKTKVIIAVHLYGVPCDIEKISIIAKENNCYLIEDCAHALGAKYGGKNLGTFGDISFFSFNFDKPISTGEGGMLVINNGEMIEDVKRNLENYKRVPIDVDKKIAYNLLVQHIATQKEIYKKTLSINFAKKLLIENQDIFNIIDCLIKTHSSEYEIENALLPYLKNKDALLSDNKPVILAKSIFRNIKLMTSRLKLPKANKIEFNSLLMNSGRAAVGMIGLETIDYVNNIRNKNAKYFEDSLDDNDSYILPKIDRKKSPFFLRYSILNNTKNSLSHISTVAKNKGFEIGNYNWPKPVHLIYPYNKILCYNRKDLKTSEYIADHIINLPVHYYVEKCDISEMIKILSSFEMVKN